MKVKVALIACLSFLLTAGIQAQELFQYTKTDGLAHNQISYIFPDINGYLWIGTWAGLSRFDSHSFKTYLHDPKDSSSVHFDQVKKIEQDNKGNMWVLTRKGLSKYVRKQDCFHRLEHLTGNEGNILRSEIKTFSIDNFDRLWILQDSQLFVTNQTHSFIEELAIDMVFSSNGLIQIDNNILCLASSAGIFEFALSDSTSLPEFDPSNAIRSLDLDPKLNIKKIPQMMRLSPNSFLICNESNQLIKVEIQSGIATHIFDPYNDPFKGSGSINFMGFESPGNIWLGSNNLGIRILSLSNNKLIPDTIAKLFEHENVFHILKGNQGNTWIATLTGLYKYFQTQPSLQLEHWAINHSSDSKANQNRVVALSMNYNDQSVWVGTMGGGLQHINIEKQNIEKIKPPSSESTISDSNYASCLFRLSPNQLLVGYGPVLWNYNSTTRQYQKVKELSKWGRTIFRDSRNRVWIADLDSIYITNPDNWEFISIPHSDIFHKSIYISSITEDTDGQIWLGTHDGLVIFNEMVPSQSQFIVPPGSETEPLVMGISQFSCGTIWIGTLRSGIYCFDIQKDSFVSRYNTQSGLANNQVYAIYEDKKKRLWASTQTGISCINPHSGEIVNYTKADGLPFSEFNAGAHAQAADGQIYFGGMGGTVAFFPDSLIQNFEEPPIVIHRITNKNGIVSLNYPVGTDESLEFDYQNNSLNIDFGCIDYLNDDKRKFQYRLLGQHDDWQTAYNPNRILHFYNLKHGKYELEIQSTISQMTWSGNIFSLKIEIQQAPFWMNRLFRYSLIVGVFLLMIIVLLRMRLANVTKQIQISTLETEANLSAFKFLKSQMNPHFFFNTLNAINHYILNSDVRSANRYLSLFSRLMRDMLDNSNEEFIEVHAEIDILNKYLELQKVRFNNKFTYSIESMPAALEMKIPPMFIQPFIENAVEHAFIDRIGSGQISVHFEKEEYSLKVIVEDNGIGIEKSLQMKSFGSKKSVAIQNIKHRIGILKQIYNSPIAMNIEKSNNNNEEYPGTRIVLQLPDFNLVKNSPGKG